MFNWVCPRCGHDVPPSKTECPLCFPPSQEVQAPPPQQYQPPQQPPPPPAQPQQPQYAPPGPPPPPQYGQQAPPQYWPPQGQPQQYPPPPYAQQAPPQYWPQQPPQQAPPQQYQPQAQYPPQQPPYQPPTSQEPPVQQYAPPPVPYNPPPAPVTEYRQPERAATPWPPPEERSAKPTWLIAVLATAGFLALFGAAYFLMGSHGSSSSAKDASAKQQTTNPLQKYVEVVGIRLVSAKGGQAVKFLVVNHSGVELTDLSANVTLYASTQRSEEDSVGTFTFKADSIGANESKEMTAPLKSDKRPSEMPDDWRNISADVQVQGPQ